MKKTKSKAQKFAEIILWVHESRKIRFTSLSELPSTSIIPNQWVEEGKYANVIENIVASREFPARILSRLLRDPKFLDGVYDYICIHPLIPSAV